MAKRHEAPEEEEETAPFWVISFSDMMTLLLTFFIMLFTMSSLEVEKVKEAAGSFAEQFGGAGKPAGPDRRPSSRPGFTRGTELSKHDRPSKSSLPMIDAAEEAVKGGIVLFDLGSDTLSESAQNGLRDLVEQLRGLPNQIMIRGHASLKEQDTRNADDLAYTRCWNVREFLVSLGLQRQDFQMSVVGQNEPLDPAVVQRKLSPDALNSYVSISLINNAHRPEPIESP